MPADDKVQELESEFKLIKGELRQTMVNVRDYLLNFRIPTAPPSVPAAPVADIPSMPAPVVGLVAPTITPGGDMDIITDSTITTTDTIDMSDPPPVEMVLAAPEDIPEDILEIPAIETAPEEADSPLLEIVEEPPEIADDVILPEPEPEPEPEPPAAAPEGAAGKKGIPFNPNSLPVNLLTNLIRWVATAKARIGTDQMPTFLEIYGSSGQLSAELKDFIMHLVDEIEETAAENTNSGQDFIRLQMANLLEICSANGQLSAEMKTGIMHLTDMLTEPTPEASPVDVWSRLMIELQGIIAEGGEPLRPTNIPWQEKDDDTASPESDSETKTGDRAQLKLVLPVNEVGDQEFVLNLTTETNRENEAEE